jgi:hypothetical protein
VLAALAIAEKYPLCRKAELHTITGIVTWHPSAVIAAQEVRILDPASLTVSEQEYLAEFETDLEAGRN